MGHNLGNNYGKSYSFLSKPVVLDVEFKVDNTAAVGVTGIKGQGVSKVFMYSSAPASGNPLVATVGQGYALIQLAYNYNRIYAGAMNIIDTAGGGSALAINATALTAGQPYIVNAVGAGPTGTTTIAPVADVSGSLASTWFRLYDAYGNTFIIWFSVAGVGSAPSGVSGTLVQQSIASGATAATIGAALVTTIAALPSGVSGVFSFTASGTTTVTVVSTKAGQPLPGVAADGAIATGFTFALTKFGTNQNAWKSVGLPAGIVPAVGQSFVALNTGYATGGGSTGTVKVPTVSGVSGIEVVGDANLSIAPIPMNGSPNVGSWVMVQFLGATSSSVTTLIPTAPAQSSIVKFALYLEEATRVGGNNE